MVSGSLALLYFVQIRAVQRPVHPIQSIGARAPGGPEMGPLLMNKMLKFSFGKKERPNDT